MLDAVTLDPMPMHMLVAPCLATKAERRLHQRRRIVRAALANVEGEQSSIPCVVLDFSQNGARLGVHRDMQLPERFALAIDSEGVNKRCRIGWRRGNALGVVFE